MGTSALLLCASCAEEQTTALEVQSSPFSQSAKEPSASPEEQIDEKALAYEGLRTLLEEQGQPFWGEGKNQSGYSMPSYQKSIYGEVPYNTGSNTTDTVFVCVGLVGKNVEIIVDYAGGRSTLLFVEDGAFLEISVKKKDAFDCAERAKRGRIISSAYSFSEKHVTVSGGIYHKMQPRETLLFSMWQTDKLFSALEADCSFETLGYRYIYL